MKINANELERRQSVRFGLVGTISTSLDMGIYAILTFTGTPAIISNFLSTAVGFCFSFFSNRSYTFRSTGQDIKKQILLFTIVTLSGLWVLQPFIIYLFELLHNQELSWMMAIAAKIVATPVTMIYNYLLYTKIVFKTKDL